jgi:hypothetical protein
MSALSARGSASCVNCGRLRDEITLLRMARGPTALGQQLQPPLLYQLQRGLPARPPVPELTSVSDPPASAVAKPKSILKKKSSPAPAAVPSTSASAAAASQSAIATVTTDSQTVISDLHPAAVAEGEPSCSRCPCCAVNQFSLESLHRKSEQAETALEESLLLRRKHEADVATWQRNLKNMREQLTAAQAQLHASNGQRQATVALELQQARSQAADYERTIQLLQEQRSADHRTIARLQLQLQPTTARTVAGPSPAAVDGLSELQRQQFALRMGAEQTLQRLQQLFPDQHIG